MSASLSASRPERLSQFTPRSVAAPVEARGSTTETLSAVPLAEAAGRLGVSEARMRELFAEGRIMPLQLAGRTMVPCSELARVLSDVI